LKVSDKETEKRLRENEFVSRVARWFISEPNPQFWYILEGLLKRNS
jgi:hypothetical protein